MFYSQFILAKKGPLGTIWIAAHLERKLRKNQVADTDIGVSVDSILFPEVPIALRLSSHLLLGVVRIYSRKVNYLFDDCSEALLKVKQAFRSTAVDLPPEESTAPYHSITLPETFDLDDFELPNNDLLQGNFVDTHVSTREQITLQDSMEGVVYSTSQFGLDERFGDGDTSGLDLEEELLLEKVAAPGHSGVLDFDDDPQTSEQVMTPLKLDENYDEITQNLEAMLAPDHGDQIGHPSHNSNVIEYAHAPCTPGLMEEPNLPNVQEASAFDDHLESEDHNLTESAATENLENSSNASNIHRWSKNADGFSLLNDLNLETAVLPAEEHGDPSRAPEIEQSNLLEHSPFTAVTMEQVSSEYTHSVREELDTEVIITKEPAFDGPDRREELETQVIISNEPAFNGPDRREELETQVIISNEPAFDGPDRREELETQVIITTEPAFDGPDRREELETQVIHTNEPGLHCVDAIHVDSVEPRGDRLDEAETSYSVSHQAYSLQKSCGNIEHLCPSNEVALNAESPGNLGTEAFREPKDILAGTSRHILQPCNSHMNVPITLNTESVDSVNLGVPYAELQISSLETSLAEELSSHILQPCNSHMNEPIILNTGSVGSVNPGVSSAEHQIRSSGTSLREELPHTSGAVEVQGEGSLVTGVTELVSEENQVLIPDSIEHNQVDYNKVDDQPLNLISHLENVDNSDWSEMPAPEKLLSVPERIGYLPNNMLMEFTPDTAVSMGGDRGGADIRITSGKKRSFTESTLTVQSLNSAEFLGLPPSKRTRELVPDDDDLLSSILVGRSSVLKLKPTPLPPSEITSSKRARSTSRVNASKRKVLMDDMMVLHGDTIRQQLTSTEDIRRIRKKAPCTRTEIWMIQKHFLNEEIFSEFLLTGSSMELLSLHNQAHDLTKIRVCRDDEMASSLEAANNSELSMGPVVAKEAGMEVIAEDIFVSNDRECDAADIPVHTEHQMGVDLLLSSQGCDVPVQMKANNDLPKPTGPEHELSGEKAEIEIDGESALIADAMDPSVAFAIEPSSSYNLVSGKMFAESVVEPASLDINSALHYFGMSPDQKLDTQPADLGASTVDMDTQPADLGASTVDMYNGNEVDTMDVSKTDVNVHVVVTGSNMGGDFLLEETPKNGTSVEIQADIEMDFSAHTNFAAPCTETSYPDTNMCSDQIMVTFDPAIEDFGKINLEVEQNDGIFNTALDFDDNNPTSSGIFNKESNVDSSYSVEIDELAIKASINDGEYPESEDAVPERMVDEEIAAGNHAATENFSASCINVGEFPEFQEAVQERMMDDEISAGNYAATKEFGASCINDGTYPEFQEAVPESMMDEEIADGKHAATEDEEFGGFDYTADGHDTGFLNDDDDDDVEEDNDFMPNTEEAHFLENCGWSSRTRAVAKYLQTVFDKEAESGRKVLPLDNLLKGKSRKEASRMFFETLVLKTRDYIDVEQGNPFDNIAMKPQIKLMKSSF